jgi:large repetitive protein
VTFTLNGSETCTADTDTTGTATCDITAGEPSSSYTLTASFPGDTTTSTPIGSDSSTTTFTVNPDTSSLTYTGSTTAVNGQPVTLSGTLTTDNPTSGTPLPTKVVTFTIGSGSTAQSCSGTTDVSGNVSCTIATVDQPSGTEPINASFTGDSYDTPAPATSSLSVTEPTILTVNPTTVTYGGSTTVSGTLTDSNLNQPVQNEPVTFTVNGTETCTGTTDSTGLASCTITPGESTGTYSVSGTFGGDSTQPVPLTTSTSSAAFVVTPAVTTLTYIGANSTTNGQPVVLSAVLTTGSTPLAGQPVTLTLGSGSSAQTCAATTTATGAATCTIASVNQPVGPNPVSATYPGTNNYQPASATSTVQVGPTAVSTTLTVTSTTGTYGSPTTVTGTLVNNYTNTPVSGETVTLKLNGTQSCTGTTNASGVATCSITPSEPGGSYTLSGSFGGDTKTVPTLLPSTGSGTFVETKAPTTVTYTGSTSISSGTSPTLSATLTSNGAPVAGQTVTFTVGTGSSAQKCSGTTNSAGNVSCGICMFNQSASPLPVTVSYGGNSYYSTGSTSESVTVNTPTSLSVTAVTGTTGQPTTVTGTLTNAVTGQGISGQLVTLTLNGAQSCTATTGSTGKASCAITPNEASGTYVLTGSFAGNTTTTQLLASTGHNNFVVTPAPTTVIYTGATTATNASSVTLSSTLTSNGTPLSGQSVVLSLGTGKTVQSCTATTTAAGIATCSIPSVNQVAGSVSVTVSYAGNGYYQSASASSTVKIANAPGSGSGSGGSGGSSGGGSSGSGGSEPPPVGGGKSGPCPGM